MTFEQKYFKPLLLVLLDPSDWEDARMVFLNIRKSYWLVIATCLLATLTEAMQIQHSPRLQPIRHVKVNFQMSCIGDIHISCHHWRGEGGHEKDEEVRENA